MMKNALLLTIIISFTLITEGFGQWQKVYDSSYSTSLHFIGERILVNKKSDGLAMSIDNGATWKQVSKDVNLGYASKITATDSGILASCYGGIHRSLDSGNSWKFYKKWPYNRDFYRITQSGKNLVAFNSEQRVILSKDFGNTWDSTNTGLVSNNYGMYPWYNYRLLSGFIKFGEKLIVVSYGPGYVLFTSSDHGETWVPKISNNPLENVGFNAVSGKIILVANKALYISYDSGSYWHTLKLPYTKSGGVRSPLFVENYIVAVLDSEGVIYSRDSGNSWKYLNNGLGKLSGIYGIAANSNYLFCASYQGGIYRRPISEFTQISDIEERPLELKVQIYPNPISNTATVDFGRNLKNGSLKLNNLIGQEVLKIEGIDEDKVLLIRDKLPAGVYLYEVSERGMKVASGKIEFE